MPHCVLVLRLIGYSFNVYDGTQPEASLSKENKEVCLKTRPGFIQYCGFMCFPASFLVGPQFPYKRYDDFCNGSFKDPVSSNIFYLNVYCTIFSKKCVFLILIRSVNKTIIISSV